jgi:multiphosphoryl transfer protein
MAAGIDLEIRNRTGLHARPARELVNVAKQFRSAVRVFHGGRKADGKSLVSLLTLGVKQGSVIRIETEGDDCDLALQALTGAVVSGLNDMGDEPAPAPSPAPPVGRRGLPAAPGLAVGPAHRWSRKAPPAEGSVASAVEEKDRLAEAIGKAGCEIRELRDKLALQTGSGASAIFDVHLEILDDPSLLSASFSRIDQGQEAGEAWRATLEEQAARIAALDDPLLAGRSADLRDVAGRVTRILSGEHEAALGSLPAHPVLLVAEDLSPSEAGSLDRTRILGLCLARGGPTSHAAILARALGVPSVVRAGTEVLDWPDGTVVVLDGDTGAVTANPDPDTLDRAREEQQRREKQRGEAERLASVTAVTRDGHGIEIVANVGSVDEAMDAFRSGADGIGLLRSEFLFMNRLEPPGEEEQFQIYQAAADVMQGRPVTVRTLDVGGDKPLAYLHPGLEANPFLGERGIRLCLARPDLLRQQLRAILRAGQTGRLRIMFPMITDIGEWRAARAMVREVAAEAGVAELEIGLMIEVPAAALLAGVFALEADFLSIGSNDLAQYTLAMDRTHPVLASRADALHPAVLNLIAQTIGAAHREGRKVGVCGELGCDSVAVPILVGLGVDELSVNVPAVASVKAQIRSLSFEDAKQTAARALQCVTAEEVREVCRLTAVSTPAEF